MINGAFVAIKTIITLKSSTIMDVFLWETQLQFSVVDVPLVNAPYLSTN